MAPADRLPGIRPRPSLGRRLDILARQSFPTASTAVLMLLLETPLGFTGQAALLPAVAVAAVYFWSLFRPGAMPPITAFALGILLDLLGMLPTGVGPLTLLLTQAMCLRWRPVLARQGFLRVYLAFIGFAVVAAGLVWALSSLLLFVLLPWPPAVLQALVSAALYPGLAIVLTGAHRSIADPDRA